MMTRMSRNPVRRARALFISVFVALATAVGVAPAANAYPVYPGDAINVRFSNGDIYSCTLNSVAHRDGALWGVTAGHCLLPIGGAHPVKIFAYDLTTPIASNLSDSGVVYDGGNAAGFADVAWFRLDNHVSDGGAVRGGTYNIPFLGPNTPLNGFTRAVHPNRAIAGRAPVTAVRRGQIICKDGGTTARNCGPVVHVNTKTGEIWSLMLAAQGDSGSPVYVLTPDRRALLVGVHSGAVGIFSVADASLPLPGGLR